MLRTDKHLILSIIVFLLPDLNLSVTHQIQCVLKFVSWIKSNQFIKETELKTAHLHHEWLVYMAIQGCKSCFQPQTCASEGQREVVGCTG